MHQAAKISPRRLVEMTVGLVITSSDIMIKIPRKYLLLIVIIILFALIWSKLRIVVFVGLSLWQAILLFSVAALVIFLVVDHLINKS